MDRRRRDLLPSPAPTPVGDHQPTSLYLLPDGQEIYVYKNRDGVLVTDDVDGSTRLVDDVCREVRRVYSVAKRPSNQQQQANNHGAPFPIASQGNFQTQAPPQPPSMGRGQHRRRRRNDLENRPSPLPSPAPSPVEDVCREVISNRRARPSDLPPLHADTKPNVLASKELLGTTTLMESSITNDSSLSQPTLHADTEPNVLASKELLDTTTLKESSITNDSSLSQPTSLVDTEPHDLALKELLDTSPLKELSISSASSPPQTTSPLKDELIPTPQLLQALDKAQASANLFLTQPSDYAYHYWPLEEPDMFSFNELSIVMATLGKSSITDASSTRADVVTHSTTPHISARKPTGWNHQFFIRVDLDQVFHTYPKLGGPFRSLEEAEMAIHLHLDELHDPKMRTNEGLSSSEIAIRDALYWPDGKRKYSSRSNPDEDHMGLLVQALLDKYNEENTLSGDCAYQVENVVSFQEVYEGDAGWYYHLNCTRKTKGGVDNLFFAEVSKMKRGKLEEFELTCLRMLESVDNGTCYGCTNDHIGMKHPIDAGIYKGGHDPSWPRGYGSHPLDFPDVDMDNPLAFPKDVDAWMKAEEKRIRCLFGDYDVAKSDAGRTPACSDMSQGRSLKYVVPARRFPDVDMDDLLDVLDAWIKPEERFTCLFRDDDVAKSDAGWTPVCSDMSQGRRLKYVVPGRRRLV